MRMYYLHTRWYDPEIGRFINLDQIQYLDPQTVNGLNLFAYCNNNPVMNVDPYGTFLSTIVGFIIGGIWGAVNAAINGQDVGIGFLIGAVEGAITGAVIDATVATVGVAAGVAITAGVALVVGAAGEIATEMLLEKREVNELDPGKIIAAGFLNSISAVAGYGISVITPVKEFTYAGAGFLQFIFGFGLGFFPSIPGYIKAPQR